jgi:hypothetical protein
LLPSETEKIGKEKEKNKFVEREADPKRRRKERKTDRKQRKKLKINCCLCVSLLLQVTVIFTAGKEGKRRRSHARSTRFQAFPTEAREPTCHQWW